MNRSMLGVAIALLAAAVVLAGCTDSAPTPAPVPEISGSATPTPTNGAAVPELVPDGTATDNLAYFNYVHADFIAAGGRRTGRELIDNLVAAGFTKVNMEVVPDKTAIGLDADNIQYSVRFGDTCIIGQFGNVGFHSTTAPTYSTGTCLIGATRTIDW